VGRGEEKKRTQKKNPISGETVVFLRTRGIIVLLDTRMEGLGIISVLRPTTIKRKREFRKAQTPRQGTWYQDGSSTSGEEGKRTGEKGISLRGEGE